MQQALASAATMACPHLQLNRDISNSQFVSWRLAGGPQPAQQALELPGTVARHKPESYDYLSARVAALRNHLHAYDGRLWAFIRTAAGGFGLCTFQSRGDQYAISSVLGVGGILLCHLRSAFCGDLCLF